MSEKKIRALILGATGVVGTQAIQLLTEKGVEVVAALGRSRHLGEDAGEVAGIGRLGVTIESIQNLEAVIERTKPNIAIDATDPYLKNIAPYLFTCAKHGVNVITLSIEAYYPWVCDQALADQLDAACKEGKASIVALGIQDVNFSSICAVISGNCHKIERIHGENWCTVDCWGPMAAEDSRTACTPERFQQRKEEGIPQNSYTYALYDIAATLGLHVTKETNDIIPTLSNRDYYCEEQELLIPAGSVIMSEQKCELETEEGITIDASIFYTWGIDGWKAENLWEIKGEPDMRIVTEDMRGDVVTTYDVINRVPDVINARPGMLTVKDLPTPTYKHFDLEHYLV